MNTVIYVLGVAAFFLGLLASIALHELGHLYPAKKFGVKVTQYFVGFGRTVWSVRRGETEYGVKIFPLGGFVKLVGMLPPGKGEAPTKLRASNTGMFTQLIADARAAEYEHVRPEEEDRLFYRKPWWQKLIVMASGPLVNIAIAVVLFVLVFSVLGLPKPTTTVAAVSDCVVLASEQGRECTTADPVAPAKQAGLQPGDRIVSFNGVSVTSWVQLTDLIRGNDAGSARIGIVRDGASQVLTTNTLVAPRPDSTDPGKLVSVGFLGVGPATVTVRHGLTYVAATMWTYTERTGAAILDLPSRIGGVVQAAFGGERSVDSPMSVVGASRVAGDVVTVSQLSWSDRVASLLELLATVNLFVALFNFVPLLPLDGGHIAGALWEAVRRGIARLRRRPDPGYVDVGKMLPVAYAVAGVLIVMGALLVYADIVNPVRFL